MIKYYINIYKFNLHIYVTYILYLYCLYANKYNIDKLKLNIYNEFQY